MAKGAGMIHPDMATLLALVTTDADVAAPDLQALLTEVAESSFNSITVDGDTSTNDTLFALANGAAGGPALVPGEAGFAALRAAFLGVCESLAEQVVADAEGATKHFRVTVAGGRDDAEARLAARTVAVSPLVKTAVPRSRSQLGTDRRRPGPQRGPFQPRPGPGDPSRAPPYSSTAPRSTPT
jgi:glutamate N-acetyltransferase/amino-acid N-acetyltransferase